MLSSTSTSGLPRKQLLPVLRIIRKLVYNGDLRLHPSPGILTQKVWGGCRELPVNSHSNSPHAGGPPCGEASRGLEIRYLGRLSTPAFCALAKNFKTPHKQGSVANEEIEESCGQAHCPIFAIDLLYEPKTGRGKKQSKTKHNPGRLFTPPPSRPFRVPRKLQQKRAGAGTVLILAANAHSGRLHRGTFLKSLPGAAGSNEFSSFCPSQPEPLGRWA